MRRDLQVEIGFIFFFKKYAETRNEAKNLIFGTWGAASWSAQRMREFDPTNPYRGLQ